MDTPNDILDEFTRIMASLDQAQVDINNARETLKGNERAQHKLDLEQIALDSLMSKLRISIGYLKRNLL